ncbi:MAG: hypothetical protein JWN82_471 [Candidatus Saccharibacteria bacterium]|nr:hypothetical protein [Candidatus Saccharibacteria bacterium]
MSEFSAGGPTPIQWWDEETQAWKQIAWVPPHPQSEPAEIAVQVVERSPETPLLVHDGNKVN